MEEERTITLDLGSSPDPLIDPVLSPPMMPPSAIKKRTQAAERLVTAFAPPSPRKQTFELDVGDERTPQRLLVTVEAEGDGPRSTTRRLFQSPTPKQRRLTPRRESTITTKVPLRGLSDDEGGALNGTTPKRRGRPRKSSTPATTRRKRPGTPAKARKSTGRASVSPEKILPRSDAELETTPRPSTQRATKRKATSPAKQEGVPESQPRKRGRPRKQTNTADDIARSGQENTPKPDNHDDVLIAPALDQPANGMEDDDIWLATLSDQPTPVPSARQQQTHESGILTNDRRAESEPQLPRHEPEPQQQWDDWPDMGGGADSYSEAESLASDQDDGQGFDNTVMAEEFTMISIGSLPSMQPNSSVMAPAHEELGEATSLIINGALESLRQSQNRSAEDHSRVEPARALIEAQPSGGEVEEPPVQRHQEAQVLPPPRSPQPVRRSPRRATAQPLARQLAQKSLEQVDRQSPALPRQSPAPSPSPITRQSPAPEQSRTDNEARDTSAYEDSFSEIPEAVLAAATPRRYRQPRPQTDEPTEDIQPSIERPSRVNHSNPQSETNRLLTPDETPSPIPSDAEDHAPQQPKQTRPPADADLPSSPPIESPVLSHAVAQLIRRNSTETPADQLSSFTSSNTGPPRDPNPLHLPVPEAQRRPTLSPIVRAGRALQLITSDPPSPPERGSVLGSPFRSSVPKSSQSPAPVLPPAAPAAETTRSPPQPRADAAVPSPSRNWLAPLNQVRDFIVRSAQSLSPARVSVSGTDHMDDPFGPDPGESIGSGSADGSPAEGSQRSPSPGEGDVASPRGSLNEHAQGNRPEDRDEPARHSGLSMLETSPRVQEVSNKQEARPDEKQQEEEEEEDEDEDIWAIEAQRPTPYAPRHATTMRESQPAPPPRSKMTSPRKQRIRRSIYGREPEQDPGYRAPGRDTPADDEEEPSLVAQSRRERASIRPEKNATADEEEFSMLSQSRQGQTPAVAKQTLSKKPDLAAFFSSPAVLPDLAQASAVGMSNAPRLNTAEQSNPVTKPRTLPAQRPQSSGNSLFAQYLQPQSQTQLPLVPQKQLEIGTRQRSVDLFSPVRRSAEQSSPEQSAAAVGRSSSPQSPEKTAPARTLETTDLVSASRFPRTDTRLDAAAPRTASPESLDETSFGHIPQKMNFTPRRREESSTLFHSKPVTSANSLFGNSQISAFFSQSRPQPQRPRAPLREEDNGAETEGEDEERGFVPPRLKSQPNRAASPTKSSFRSPLKPKTPGRVVEFTSSTLSPLAQAQARADQRASTSPHKRIDNRPVASRGTSFDGMEEDKENRSSSSSSPSLSPSLPPSPSLSPSPSPPPSPSPRRNRFTSSSSLSSSITTTNQEASLADKSNTSTTIAPLSPTTWTRAHWLRLDELLQARKQGAHQLQRQLRLPHRQSMTLSFFSSSTTTARRTPTWARRGGGDDAGSGSSMPVWRQRLLGKQVTAQGERMEIEGWHLDVVEGFLAEVGGGLGSGSEKATSNSAAGAADVAWDAAQIVKRVFALLVGEERRRLGLVPPRRGDFTDYSLA
ncbi:hypothetical protein C7999DRAFT_12050 [Corynascus novoguineensis]|uniref:Uncharacterized protein n=1 Tax=Corynascus novoguineensis TaxID=1126955 RepID=A0AAN7D043_9PEZI|nr:hypothetical protein C7999DRAFT_12050 [Corynascus novoguineensis]